MINKENKVNKRENVDAIYLHIPFCTRKCDYCDFCTFMNMGYEYEKYVQALIKEINLYPKYEYDTVYFGGGTPTLLSAGHISRIMENINYKSDGEITLEMNPDKITADKLRELKKAGINRLSIGIQSFQDHILKFLGREHMGTEAEELFWNARESGFKNISADLMFSIPGQTMEDLEKDLKKIVELSPENISIYSLIWEEGTVFWSKLKKGILEETDQDLEAQMYEFIIEFLEENGYIHYEISNFSKKNYFGRHNMKYWKNKEFIGAGLSAASYYRGRRYSNTRIFRKYYKSVEDGKIPVDESTIEIIDETEAFKLHNMLGLRLVQEGIEDIRNEKTEKLLERELIERICVDGKYRIRLSKKGILLANNVFVEFI